MNLGLDRYAIGLHVANFASQVMNVPGVAVHDAPTSVKSLRSENAPLIIAPYSVDAIVLQPTPNADGSQLVARSLERYSARGDWSESAAQQRRKSAFVMMELRFSAYKSSRSQHWYGCPDASMSSMNASVKPAAET